MLFNDPTIQIGQKLEKTEENSSLSLKIVLFFINQTYQSIKDFSITYNSKSTFKDISCHFFVTLGLMLIPLTSFSSLSPGQTGEVSFVFQITEVPFQFPLLDYTFL